VGGSGSWLAGVIVATAAGLLALVEPASGQEPGRTGVIAGRVVEAGTLRPLVAARVAIEGTALAVLTDSAGRFRHGRVPAGTYSVRVETLGHVPAVRTDVVVRTDRLTSVDVELVPAALVMEGLRVRPSYFAQPEDAPVSRLGFAAEEIRRAPGSAGDVSRIVYGLPSVAKVNDQSNGLAVRGGTPSENLFLVDGIAVPNINHFPSQGATSGPIGLLNVELIRDVQFQAGGFPAQYGDRLSSAVDISLRDGNPEARAAQLSLDLTGVGTVLEGPVAGGSLIASLRRSYLDLLVKAVDVGASVAPRYGDYVARYSVEPSTNHRFTALTLWADDRFHTDIEQALEHGMTAFGRQELLQGTTGANWTALCGRRVAVAHVAGAFVLAVRRGLHGDRVAPTALPQPFERAHAGPAASYASAAGSIVEPHVRGRRRGAARSLRQPLPAPRQSAGRHGARAAAAVGPAPGRGRRVRHADAQHPVPSVTTSLGARVDHATLTATRRLAACVRRVVGAERTTLSLSGGVYRQTLPLLMLASEAHRALRDPWPSTWWPACRSSSARARA
jgi:hypothetical protein